MFKKKVNYVKVQIGNVNLNSNRKAIDMCKWKPDRCIIYQRRNILASELDPKIDINWEDGMLLLHINYN